MHKRGAYCMQSFNHFLWDYLALPGVTKARQLLTWWIIQGHKIKNNIFNTYIHALPKPKKKKKKRVHNRRSHTKNNLFPIQILLLPYHPRLLRSSDIPSNKSQIPQNNRVAQSPWTPDPTSVPNGRGKTGSTAVGCRIVDDAYDDGSEDVAGHCAG